MTKPLTIAYQGEPGAYSDLVAAALYPGSTRIGHPSFEAVLAAAADIFVIPVTNTIAGPVVTAIPLLEASGLSVVKAYWHPIRHALLGLPDAALSDISQVYSHWQALAQCRKTLEALSLTPVEHEDTAGAARMVAANGNISQAAIASAHAAREYGLKILKDDVQDDADNKTLFLALSRAGKGDAVADVLKTLGLA